MSGRGEFSGAIRNEFVFYVFKSLIYDNTSNPFHVIRPVRTLLKLIKKYNNHLPGGTAYVECKWYRGCL